MRFLPQNAQILARACNWYGGEQREGMLRMRIAGRWLLDAERAAVGRAERCAARRQRPSRSAAAPSGVISLITDKICTSERNPQRQIRGTLSRAPQKRRRRNVLKKRSELPHPERAVRKLITPNHDCIFMESFGDCWLGAELLFSLFAERVLAFQLFIFAGVYSPHCSFRRLMYRFLCSQVWFQNARAKWRRMVTKQENKMVDKCSPDASLEMDMYHGPMGSIQSLPPHSPPYSVMGGPPSPNSMDCP